MWKHCIIKIAMTVSVVIPCFNEERYIADCLSHLLKQSVKPIEIIVVDNNSTDRTAEIAKSMGVKVISESTQGITAARNRGFNQAAGDIIARCDADTLVPSDWVEKISKTFVDKTIDGLTGPIIVYDFLTPSSIYSLIYLMVMKLLMKNHETIQGPNMAIRKSVWEEIRNATCKDDRQVHEDIDLSIHLALAHKHVHLDKTMIAKMSGRRMKNNPASFFIEYPKRLVTTLRSHNL